MKPMFSFYGSKWNCARRLGPPQREHVIEPFAGSAAYSTYWEPAKVTLVEIDPIIFGVWDYLIKTPASEILRLPVDVDDLTEIAVCQEAKWLIGFWFNIGCREPAKRRSNWGKRKLEIRTGAGGVWSEHIRYRIATQVNRIKHWKIINANYHEIKNVEAHWHIDPPYEKAGAHYRFNNSNLDYGALGDWCYQRKGFVQVCESVGAEWLPFKPFLTNIGTRGRNRKGWSNEAVFETGVRNSGLFGGIEDANGGTRTSKVERRKAKQEPARLSGKVGAEDRRRTRQRLGRAITSSAGLV